MRSRWIAISTILALTCPATLAGPPGANQEAATIDAATLMQLAGAGGGPSSAEQSWPKFEDVTKDMESTSGMFTLWHYPASKADKDQQRLLAQIPASMLGEQFMLSTSVAGGGFYTGFPLDERVVKWELLDRQLVLVQPQTQFVVQPGKEVSDVVQRTYPEQIRVAVPIVTKTPGGDPVIDLGALLKSDFADIGWMVSSYSAFGGYMSAQINPQLSKWTGRKAFPLNVEIGVELAVARSNPPGSFDKKMVHYSFWKLPQTNYTPRAADDRVGYFLTANQDWTRPASARDLFNRYIDRWQLEKRDPSLPLCEPKQPIVFYIEKTVPVKYRRAVRDGILEWNKAYEKVGFVNAIEVRQQTDDNEWKDLDPEDMRYSFFRWIVTGGGFAMGPHRANPFTGQIYDADIVMDDSMVRYFEQESTTYLPSAVAERKFNDPAATEMLKKLPGLQRQGRSWEQTFLGDPAELEQREIAMKRISERGLHLCDYADGLKREVALASTALAGQPQEVTDRFLYDLVKEVVMHEVGHTLGLRHNFRASTIYTLEEIQQRRDSDLPTCGSVMDYNPALLFAVKATDGHFVTPTIGPYDYWAIEYGYRPFDGTYKPETEQPETKEPAKKAGPVASAADGTNGKDAPEQPDAAKPITDEAGMLSAIASRASEPALAYATDEDTTFVSPDPRSNRFDMGADPLDWAASRMALVDSRMKNILDWAVKDEEAWYHLRGAFQTLLFEKVMVLDYVGRYVGGAYIERSHRGQPNAAPPVTQVEPAKQRAALRFIADHLFRDDYFAFDPAVLNHLVAPRWWHDGAMVSYTVEFPVHQYVGLLQWWNLVDRLSPNTLERIQDAEIKSTASDKLTVAEYLRTLQDAVWAESIDGKRLGGGSWSDTSPFVSSIRRSLQREYLGIVEPMVRAKPGWYLSPDLHAMLQYSLQTLGEQLKTVADNSKCDFASRAHLAACKSRIDRMLSAELGEPAPSMFGGMMFLRETGAAQQR